MKKENIPNILTLGRIFIYSDFCSPSIIWTVSCVTLNSSNYFAIASITDYLDGYLARKWQVV